jgi:phosphatidylinositol alpha-1,6-mannosyltransferase
VRELLITNDFPPMPGGEAAYYARICATVGHRAAVLAPRLRGDRAGDARRPHAVIRCRVPIHPHPVARLIQILLFVVHALRIVPRLRIATVHLGHLYLGPVGLALRRILGVPYVLYLHGGEMAPYMRRALVRAVVRRVVASARLVVVNSTYTRRQYEALGLDPARVEVLTMSVGVSRFRLESDPGQIRATYALDGQKVILTVGRLVARKGHDVVIKALAAVRDAVGPIQYLIAGRGPEEPRLRRLAQDIGCAHAVRFLGHVPDDELPRLYAACDIVVMPSRTLEDRDGVEGFGITFVEAGASGKPVIGGRSGGVGDAVLDGVTGILVEPESVEEVATAMLHLLRHPEVAAAMGREGRCRAEALDAAWPTAISRIWRAPVHGGPGRGR